MKKFLYVLLLVPMLTHAQPADLDKLINNASNRTETFYIIECEDITYIAYHYDFHGSVMVITTPTDAERGNRKRYIINVDGCSYAPFKSTMRAELIKLKDEEAEFTPTEPTGPSLESISKKRIQLRQTIEVLQQRLKAEYFYTDEKQKMYDAIDFLQDELKKLPMPGEQ